MAGAQRKYVVLTRALAQSEALAETLLANDILSIICPIFVLKYNKLEEKIANKFQAVLLTSARAVEALAHAGAAEEYTRLPCFCVGKDTAQAARTYGFIDVRSAGGDAAALARTVAQTLDGRSGALFYPRGEDVFFPLAGVLAKDSFVVVEQVVYRMELSPVLPGVFLESLKAGRVACLTFYSARTARHFVNLVEEAGLTDSFHSIKALCISAGVLECVRRLNWAGTYVAQEPNGDCMLALIGEHMKFDG